ncbi:hypothetical protein DPMN_149157 [Dreissena polymorpha]|uniref:Uncharacterized protein n=1 Tax=Dreissena polymorpha TaxID=45954 RepID=A0A9D4FGW8_DREPO|nr:hypothetical protein DPMN_149157 [Dreissena polymorpha]
MQGTTFQLIFFPAVLDQAGDQHAGMEADESGMSTGDTSGVTDEGEVHQPVTDDALAARDGSMGDPPDDQQKNKLPCFEELLSDMFQFDHIMR